MYRFPLIDAIVEYFRRIRSYGFTYCLWLMVVGCFIGIGIVVEQWVLVIAGVAVWIIGGLVLASGGKSK